MKRTILTILVMSVLMALALTGCDNGSTGGASWNPVGTWVCVYSSYFGGVFPYDEKVIVKSNGTFEWTNNDELSYSGNYEYDDEEIRLNITWSNDGMGLGLRSLRYDSATKELVLTFTNGVRRYAKQ